MMEVKCCCGGYDLALALQEGREFVKEVGDAAVHGILVRKDAAGFWWVDVIYYV